jgi:hypothetical protein
MEKRMVATTRRRSTSGGAVPLRSGGWYGGELIMRHNIGHHPADEP